MATADAPAAKAGGKGKIFGLDPKVAIIVAGVALVAVWYFVLRKPSSSGSSSGQAPSSPTDTGSMAPAGATGGGAASPDLSSLIDALLQQQQAYQQDLAGMYLTAGGNPQNNATATDSGQLAPQSQSASVTVPWYSTAGTSPYVQQSVGPAVVQTPSGNYSSPWATTATEYTANFMNSPTPAAPTPYTSGGSVNVNQAFK